MSRAQVESMDPSRSINISSPVLVLQLNQLLASLNIPITVVSHSQLTPSLLIGILESLSSARLSIPKKHRDNLSSSNTSKVHCMKIFLGVMQSDILKQDVGIGNLDPRRLAEGADEETLYVARLLCWYGRHNGLISRSGRNRRDESGSPSTLTTATRRTATATSPVHLESNTSVSAASSFEDAGPASPAQYIVAGARCIHEIPSPSLVLSPGSHVEDLDASFFALGAHPGDDVESRLNAMSHTNSTVRYDGYISLVDEDAEVAAFLEARERAKGKGKGKCTQTTADRSTRHVPAIQRDLSTDDDASASLSALAAAQARAMELQRRHTEMLEELAQLRVSEYERLWQ
ncbi:hypothetical protein B0H14DRAFT_261145 [Mycena olivaceomarginata]|nr:hypothetical protein B0H14DRAFT_261145 [Mycena olivaceomarginata]